MYTNSELKVSRYPAIPSLAPETRPPFHQGSRLDAKFLKYSHTHLPRFLSHKLRSFLALNLFPPLLHFIPSCRFCFLCFLLRRNQKVSHFQSRRTPTIPTQEPSPHVSNSCPPKRKKSFEASFCILDKAIAAPLCRLLGPNIFWLQRAKCLAIGVFTTSFFSLSAIPNFLYRTSPCARVISWSTVSSCISKLHIHPIVSSAPFSSSHSRSVLGLLCAHIANSSQKPHQTQWPPTVLTVRSTTTREPSSSP